MKIIAYLAPEIPALSATFVYNEILALQEKRYKIIPISVHLPSSKVHDSRVTDLAKHTTYLYNLGLLNFLLASVIVLFSSPLRFLRGIIILCQDIIRVGLLNRLAIGLIFRFLVACRVSCILHKKKCTHLHAHFAHIPTDIAMYSAILTGITFSFTSHANDLFERGWLLPQKISRSKFAATISDFNKKHLLSLGGDKKKIHIIRCGVNSKTFTAIAPFPCVAPYTLGTLGRMVEKKGFDILLQAGSILRDKKISFQIIIAGSGPLEEDLKNLTKQLNMTTYVQFIGSLPNENVPSWLKTLDLFVLPCQQDQNGDMDGIPVVLMEAMLSGIPVVSSNISGIPELITHKKSGLLVGQKEGKELAEAILSLLSDPILRKNIEKNAVKKVRSEFDLELNINRLIGLFKK